MCKKNGDIKILFCWFDEQMRAIDGIVVFLHPFDGVLTDENQKQTQILLKIASTYFNNQLNDRTFTQNGSS